MVVLALLSGCGPTAQSYLDVMRAQRDAWKEMADILTTVKDDKSLAEAKAALEERVGNYEAISRKARSMPPPSREAVRKLAEEKYLMERTVQRLNDEVRRVQAMPGGKEFFKHFESKSQNLFQALQP